MSKMTFLKITEIFWIFLFIQTVLLKNEVRGISTTTQATSNFNPLDNMLKATGFPMNLRSFVPNIPTSIPNLNDFTRPLQQIQPLSFFPGYPSSPSPQQNQQTSPQNQQTSPQQVPQQYSQSQTPYQVSPSLYSQYPYSYPSNSYGTPYTQNMQNPSQNPYQSYGQQYNPPMNPQPYNSPAINSPQYTPATSPQQYNPTTNPQQYNNPPSVPYNQPFNSNHNLGNPYSSYPNQDTQIPSTAAHGIPNQVQPNFQNYGPSQSSNVNPVPSTPQTEPVKPACTKNSVPSNGQRDPSISLPVQQAPILNHGLPTQYPQIQNGGDSQPSLQTQQIPIQGTSVPQQSQHHPLVQNSGQTPIQLSGDALHPLTENQANPVNGLPINQLQNPGVTNSPSSPNPNQIQNPHGMTHLPNSASSNQNPIQNTHPTNMVPVPENIMQHNNQFPTPGNPVQNLENPISTSNPMQYGNPLQNSSPYGNTNNNNQYRPKGRLSVEELFSATSPPNNPNMIFSTNAPNDLSTAMIRNMVNSLSSVTRMPLHVVTTLLKTIASQLPNTELYDQLRLTLVIADGAVAGLEQVMNQNYEPQRLTRRAINPNDPIMFSQNTGQGKSNLNSPFIPIVIPTSFLSDQLNQVSKSVGRRLFDENGNFILNTDDVPINLDDYPPLPKSVENNVRFAIQKNLPSNVTPEKGEELTEEITKDLRYELAPQITYLTNAGYLKSSSQDAGKEV